MKVLYALRAIGIFLAGGLCYAGILVMPVVAVLSILAGLWTIGGAITWFGGNKTLGTKHSTYYSTTYYSKEDVYKGKQLFFGIILHGPIVWSSYLLVGLLIVAASFTLEGRKEILKFAKKKEEERQSLREEKKKNKIEKRDGVTTF